MKLGFNTIAILYLLCGVIILSSQAGAIPGPILNLKDLVEKADLIIIGETKSVTLQKRTTIQWNGRNIAGTSAQAVIKLDRAVSGSVDSASITFEFFASDEFLGFAGIPLNRFGMYFLKKTNLGSWSIADPYYPSIVASRNIPTIAETSVARVARELSFVFNSGQASLADKIIAVSAIDTLDLPLVKKLLLDAFPNPELKVRVRIASALLKRNEVSILAFAIGLILSPPPAIDKNDIWQLADSIEVGVSDPASIPSLLQLLKSTEPKVRQAVAVSLTATKSQNALSPLVFLLSDSRREVRYLAVLGLARITGKSAWGPAIDIFAQDESRFINHWKTWDKTSR